MNEISEAFIAKTRSLLMSEYLPKIERCLERLDDGESDLRGAAHQQHALRVAHGVDHQFVSSSRRAMSETKTPSGSTASRTLR